jgi:hypothetical protein
MGSIFRHRSIAYLAPVHVPTDTLSLIRRMTMRYRLPVAILVVAGGIIASTNPLLAQGAVCIRDNYYRFVCGEFAGHQQRQTCIFDRRGVYTCGDRMHRGGYYDDGPRHPRGDYDGIPRGRPYGPPIRGRCVAGFTVQDGICKPYRGG